MNAVKYWDAENPKQAKSRNYQVSWYQEADILHVERIAKNGNVVKGIAMKISELRESPELLALMTEAICSEKNSEGQN